VGLAPLPGTRSPGIAPRATVDTSGTRHRSAIVDISRRHCHAVSESVSYADR
jgi:hypothetical protein